MKGWLFIPASALAALKEQQTKEWSAERTCQAAADELLEPPEPWLGSKRCGACVAREAFQCVGRMEREAL